METMVADYFAELSVSKSTILKENVNRHTPNRGPTDTVEH
jgi:hypothetical protein